MQNLAGFQITLKYTCNKVPVIFQSIQGQGICCHFTIANPKIPLSNAAKKHATTNRLCCLTPSSYSTNADVSFLPF